MNGSTWTCELFPATTTLLKPPADFTITNIAMVSGVDPLTANHATSLDLGIILDGSRAETFEYGTLVSFVPGKLESFSMTLPLKEHKYYTLRVLGPQYEATPSFLVESDVDLTDFSEVHIAGNIAGNVQELPNPKIEVFPNSYEIRLSSSRSNAPASTPSTSGGGVKRKADDDRASLPLAKQTKTDRKSHAVARSSKATVEHPPAAKKIGVVTAAKEATPTEVAKKKRGRPPKGTSTSSTVEESGEVTRRRSLRVSTENA